MPFTRADSSSRCRVLADIGAVDIQTTIRFSYLTVNLWLLPAGQAGSSSTWSQSLSKIQTLTPLNTAKKWNESGFRPPLCTYRLNWARRTSWGWWDDWDDTVLQTQNSKFEPWRSEAEHATSRSQRLPTILTFTRGWGRNIFVSFKPPRPGTEHRTLAWKAAVLTTTLGPRPEHGYSRLQLVLLADQIIVAGNGMRV